MLSFSLPKPVSERIVSPMMTNPTLRPQTTGTSDRPAGGRVKLDELAQLLGLSKSTVSRALNGYADISDATKQRVEKTAQKMGYRPLSHAQAIRTGRVRAIAMVINNDEGDRHNPFLQDFLAGACLAASSHDWTMTISTANSDDDTLKVLGRLVEERKADGFILPRTRVDDPRVRFLEEMNVPFIMYGRTGYGAAAPLDHMSWFDISGEAAIKNAVIRLAAFGHRRIGYVGSDPKFNYALLRRDGFAEGLRAAGIAIDTDLMVDGARNREAGEKATRGLFALDAPPTAIVYATDLAALGGYRACEGLGLEVGHDVSIIGYDGIPECQYAQPGLTTFSVDSKWAGERLATMLIQQTRGESPGNLRELGEAELIIRESDGPPRLTSEELAQKITREIRRQPGGEPQ